ncbi:hypothetical protein Moror_10721 [Moniliophthora roreri MCA 2997]|uniref:Uncharacterized protein n=1 Tax=Moniliophthora roreri (strain MCA 2997) TaxID=1381753 RepID=V2XGS3_MONRO|nr:hypothetical protein Moror_10721 [Moniliophthora roreri MCA 2997]
MHQNIYSHSALGLGSANDRLDSTGTAQLSPIQPFQQLAMLPWPENSPPLPVIDPALMLLPSSTPGPSLFMNGTYRSTFTPSLPFAALSLSGTPLTASPSPSSTASTFPTLNLSKKYSRDEHVQEYNLLQTRIRELEQQVALESTGKALLKQTLDATVAQMKLEVKRAILDTHRDFDEKMSTLRMNFSKKTSAGKGDDSSSDSDSKSSMKEEGEDSEKPSSMDAAGHSSIKELTNEVFFLFCGTQRLKTRDDFPVLEDDQDENELEFIKGSQEIRQLRFDWDHTTRHHTNADKISTMATYARKVGPNIVANTRDVLLLISDKDLLIRFQTRFDQLRRNWKGTSGQSQTAPSAAPPEDGDAPLSKTKHANRASGKLKVRVRKRESKTIPEALQWIKDPKYDAAFEVNHMSDDDDFYENGKLVNSKYLARPPVYCSEKLQELFDTVDSINDPAPIAFEKRGHHWMYKLEWLVVNKEYSVETYVIENGVLWGDPTDPVDHEQKKKAVKEIKKERKRKSEGNSDGKKNLKKAKSGKAKAKAD